ncbi:efflux transporter outer membrane subunit [Acidovorax sp. DW039]|uniref:efflux transporter outer membrane subunit n=1 Tax=Acidovorax sp. DW039 TaxID=3095606 RepID=UPI00308F5E90|nr:efflux transporter outer membrane subunit [Acidovorax sp. DW039]
MKHLKLSAVALAASLLAGCAVGPDYQRPTLPETKAYSPEPMAEATASSSQSKGGEAQRIIPGRDIQADWWTLFQSPALNALIEEAFKANPDLEAAQAALRAAQENVAAQQGFFFPTVQMNYSPARTKIAGNLGGNSPGVQGNGSVISTFQGKPASEGGTAPFNKPVIYNFHTAQLSVGYDPDLFGSNRRQVESLQAQAQVQRFEWEAARITLATNIVAAAIQDALLRQQIATSQAMVEASGAAVEITRKQLAAGYVTRLDVAAQEQALAQAQQLLPPLRRQLEQNRNLLRVLAGSPPDRELPSFALDELKLPQELPLSLPSQLVEQRPDVRAAEEQLRSAFADVGVARAARLPQFSITANTGGAASNFSQMFWPSGRFFSLALGITQPLFDGGTLKHRERAAQEQLNRAAALYRSAVLSAWQNVADGLQSIHSSAEVLQTADNASQAAQATLDLTRRQHAKGYLDRLALISAEQAYRAATLNQLQARAARLGDTAMLFQALGGGWWQRPDAEVAVATPAKN